MSQDQVVRNYADKSVLLIYCCPEYNQSEVFLIDYNDNARIFMLALMSDGLVINNNDSEFNEECVSFVCELSDEIYKASKKDADVSPTYQLFAVMNHYVADQPSKRLSFDYISKVGFAP